MLEPLTTAFTWWYERQLTDPEPAQRKLLHRILSSAAGSPVADALKVSQGTSFEEFLTIPPRPYDFYEPFVQRVLDGDRHAFGRVPIVALGETSGSMGRPKLIPHSVVSLKRFSWFVQLVLIFQLRDGNYYLPKLTKWFLVTASSSVRIEKGMPIGFISGLMYRGARSSRPGFILPSPEVAAIQDWDERIRRGVAEAVPRRVGTIFGVPAYLLHFLHRTQEMTGRRPGEIWPLLQTVYYSGTSIASHKAEIQNLLAGKPLVIRGLYMSTEGYFGAELDRDADGQMRLLPDMAVLTFRDMDASEGRLRALWELERGHRYEVMVTTTSGLFQYRIGDVIEIAQTQPLRVRITGRVGEEINLATEKLSVKQAEAALAQAGPAAGCSPDRFMVVPDPAHPRRHLWIVERAAIGGGVGAGPAIDRALASINPSYAALRAGDSMLVAPRAALIPPGAFDAYVKQGFARRGQFKFKHIFPSAETLLATPGLETLEPVIHAKGTA